MAPAPARFTFDLDLGKRTTPTAPPEPTIPERLVAQLLAQAREEAYAEGLAAGARSAEATAAQSLAAAAGTLATQTANRVWAGPTTGSAATPTFRALVSADIPDLSGTYQPLNDKLTTLATGFGAIYVTPGLVRWNGTSYELLNTEIPGSAGGTGIGSYNIGDILYGNGASSLGKVAANTTTTKKFLTQTGNGTISAAPVWSTVAASDLTGTSANVQTLLAAADYAAFKASLSLGNVENVAINTWGGSGYIATLGTITSGTWHGTAIADTYISSASTWNAKENQLTFSSPLSRSVNTVSLAASGVTAGTYGSATQSLSVTVDTYGRITGTALNTITPAIGSITGLGTGIATALAINTGSAGAPVLYNGALGTPSGGNVTNCTVKDFYPAALSNESDALTTGLKLTFRIPYACTLSAVRIDVSTAPTGSVIIVDVKESGTTIFSTKPQIAVGDKTSVGGAVPGVISDTALAENAEITVFIDQIGSTIAGSGLKIVFILTR